MLRIIGAVVAGLAIGAIGMFVWKGPPTPPPSIEVRPGQLVQTTALQVAVVNFSLQVRNQEIRQLAELVGERPIWTANHRIGIFSDAAAAVLVSLNRQPLFVEYKPAADGAFEVEILSPNPRLNTEIIGLNNFYTCATDRSAWDILVSSRSMIELWARNYLDSYKVTAANELQATQLGEYKAAAEIAIKELFWQFAGKSGVRIIDIRVKFQDLTDAEIAERRKNFPHRNEGMFRRS